MLDIELPHEETDMAKQPDIAELTGKQLNDLIGKAIALQKERKADAIQELRTKWIKEADDEGFTLQEVLGIQPGKAPKMKTNGKAAAPARFSFPGGETWSGRGRAPSHVKTLLGASGVGDNGFLTEEGKEAIKRYEIAT